MRDDEYVVLEIIEKVSLYCGEGTSDKVYHAQLCKVEQGFIIKIQHGKRIYDVPEEDKSGSALQKLAKPDSGPTTYEEAKDLFDEKLKEKLHRKRYTYYQQGHVVNRQSSIYAAEGGGSHETPPREAQITLVEAPRIVLTGTGHLPQLLNPTTPGACREMIESTSYYASPKADGERFLLGLRNGDIVASNRRGEGTSVARPMESAFAEFVEATDTTAGLCLDGERIGHRLYVFDILEHLDVSFSPREGVIAVPVPYFVRARLMETLFKTYREWLGRKGREGDEAIKLLTIARTTEEKSSLYRELLTSGGEGMVLTHVQSVLRPGKPSRGGDRWKVKNWAEIDCCVAITDRQSFECFVYHEGRRVSIGFVSSGVTASKIDDLRAMERRGEVAVAVVRYLYATGTAEEGGKLFQSTFKDFRRDKGPEECLASQMEVANKNILEELKSLAA